jgi:hypothetical protein
MEHIESNNKQSSWDIKEPQIRLHSQQKLLRDAFTTRYGSLGDQRGLQKGQICANDCLAALMQARL